MGEWISDLNLPKIVHSGKYAIKNLGLKGLLSDIELIAYLVSPGSRNLDLDSLTKQEGTIGRDILQHSQNYLRVKTEPIHAMDAQLLPSFFVGFICIAIFTSNQV